MKKLMWVTVFSLCASNVWAGGLEQLKVFVNSSKSAQADFHQVVLDNKGNKIREATGEMLFQRPGKFRWVYKLPYEQIIVGDGQKFWLYDTDLEQVTVKKLDAALGSSPAALLAGDNEIERSFTLSDQGEKKGLSWLQAVPKSADSSFEKILMGFDKQAALSEMVLFDSFGNNTTVTFSNLQINPKFTGSPFKFTPPANVDVLEDL